MKVAVIGAGNIAEKHLEVLQAFSDVEIAAICSRGHPRIDALADRFGIREKFNDYRRMLDTASVDAVFVLVSAMQIVPVAAECLKRGIPTLLEKPPGLSATETEDLARIAHETNCLNMVALNRRFYSVMQRAREEILSTGPLVSVLVEGPERLGEVKAVGIHPPEIIAGLLFAPDVQLRLQNYLPIAVVAALDAVFGGLRAFLDGIFDDKVFVVSFISNVVIAAAIVYLGDKLGVGSQLSTGVVVVLGIRIFSNAAAIRRHLFHA